MESSEILDKTLVLNDEVDFTEFSYDIKLFKITRKHPFGFVSDIRTEILAYHIEIFNLNEPDLIYRYRLPVSTSRPTDPVNFVVDVFNLINHAQIPLSEDQTIESIDGIPKMNLNRYK